MITTRSFAVLGILLAAGLAVFGIQMGRAVQRGREFDRYLTVKGLSEREVKADLAIWPIRCEVTAPDLGALKGEMERARGQVRDYLLAQGVSAEEIALGLPLITDREDERIQYNREELARYKAVVVLVVRSAKVDVVKKAIQGADTLLGSGVALVRNEYGDKPEFLFTDIGSVKPAMIAEATANARAAAEKFAQDSRAEVGTIRRATQGVMEIEDRDAATPEVKTVRIVTTIDFFLR